MSVSSFFCLFSFTRVLIYLFRSFAGPRAFLICFFFFWNTEHDYEYVVVFAVEITIFTVLRPRFKVIYSPRTFIPVIGYVPRLSDSCDTKTAKLICILYLSAAFSLFLLEFFRYLPTTPMATWGSCNAGNVPKSCRTIS